MTSQQKHTLPAKKAAHKSVAEMTSAPEKTAPPAKVTGTKRAAPDSADYVRREDYDYLKQQLTKQTELAAVLATSLRTNKNTAPAPAPAPAAAVPMGHFSKKAAKDGFDELLYKGPDVTHEQVAQLIEAVEKRAGIRLSGELIQPLTGLALTRLPDESQGHFALKIMAKMRLPRHRGRISYPNAKGSVWNRYPAEYHVHLFRFFALLIDVKEADYDNLKVKVEFDCRFRAMSVYMKEVCSTPEQQQFCRNQLASLFTAPKGGILSAASQREIKDLGAMLLWHHCTLECYNNGTIVKKLKYPRGKPVSSAAKVPGDASDADDGSDDEEEEEAEDDE